ncbi:MAG: hypothetical protein ACRD1N_04310, partial [Terriglobia bacterium]
MSDRRRKLVVSGNLAPLIVLALLACSGCYAWGPEAHRLVTQRAVDTLPPGIKGYFQSHLPFLQAHVNDPNQWMKKDRYERLRHYIFLDEYGRFPYLKLPHSYEDAVTRYGSGHIARTGTLPWQIGEYSLRLTNELRDGTWDLALEDAAVMGYYVTDAHDPLNTTENYDGQLTGQTGLAARFGSALFDRYQNFMLFRAAPAVKIDDPTEYAFKIVLESHTWVDNILLADRNALDDLPGYDE